jgi:hypothetical protein
MNLNEKLRNFFDQDDSLKNYNFFVIRQDGITLYHHSQEIDKNTAGALISGVWQAATALMSFLPKKTDEAFRLSFDTSNQGIYILPLFLNGEEYFLALIYKEELNPGPVKNRLRDLKYKLEQFINNNKKSNAVKNVRKSYLFTEISEEEMDRLFSITNI